MGLCPLHTDHKPSFLVDPGQNLFYCYGCGRGGDVIRFAELYHQVKFPQALTLLREWCGVTPLLKAVTDFYRMQLSPSRSAGLSGATRSPFARSDRTHAHRLCARSLFARLADPVGLSALDASTGGPGHRGRLRMAMSDASSFRWKTISMAAVSGVPRRRIGFCRDKGGLYPWEQVRRCPGDDSGGRTVRLCGAVAGRLS